MINIANTRYLSEDLPYVDSSIRVGCWDGLHWGISPHLHDELDLEREATSMRGLFVVYIVDPGKDEVTERIGAFIARDEDSAQLKAIQEVGHKLGDIDDLDIIVIKLGSVREKKEA